MRILVVSNLYPPRHLGGYELRCAEVVAALRRRGHVLHVLTSRFRTDPLEPRDDPAVSRCLTVAQGPPYPSEALGPLLRAVASDWTRLTQVIRAFRPDVIDVWGMDGFPRAIVEGLANAPAPLHLTVEDAWPAAAWRHDALGIVAEAARALRVAAPASLAAICGAGLRPPPLDPGAVTFVSRALQHHCANRGFATEGSRVRLAGLELAELQAAEPRLPPPLEIVAVGQLTASRGFEDLIAAAARVAAGVRDTTRRIVLRDRVLVVPALRVRIIGGGNAAYIRRLTALAAAASREALRVELGGVLPPDRLQVVFAGAHLLVHPSRLPEGLPRVIVEALAAGVPVIASDSGGQRDVLENGRWGRLYRAGDVGELAAAIAAMHDRWRREAVLVRAEAAAARRHALATFDFERYVDGHLDDLRAVRSRTASAAASDSAFLAAMPRDGALPDEPLDAFRAKLVAAASLAAGTPDALADETLFRIAVTAKRCAALDVSGELFEHLHARGGASAVRRAAFHLGELALLRADWAEAGGWLMRCLETAPDHRKAEHDLEFARRRAVPPHLSDLAPVTAGAGRHAAARETVAAAS